MAPGVRARDARRGSVGSIDAVEARGAKLEDRWSAGVPLIEVRDVWRSTPSGAGGAAWALDGPVGGQQFDGNELELSGWIVAPEGVEAVHVVASSRQLRRVPVDRVRRDIGALYPGFPAADRSGFRTVVELSDWEETRISVTAVTKAGSTILIGHVIARRQWREEFLSNAAPFVSVVVAAEGGRATIADAIDSVRAQTHSHHETVIVGDLSRAEPGVRLPGGVRAIEEREPGLAAAWNTGLRRSIGGYLVFLRGTECLRPGALSAGLETLRVRRDAALALGHRSQALTKAADAEPGEFCDLAGPVGLFRRSALELAGTFAPALAEPRFEMHARIAALHLVCCHHQRVSEP
jgi:hypothetical protein